jgi:HEAT repeat protein
MRSLVVGAFVAVSISLVTPSAHATPPSKAQVRQLLSGYEDVPGAETWRRLGPETLAVLVSLYDDPEEAPYVRLRAVSVVSHYPTPATRTFLLAVARAPRQSDLFVREAVLSLGAAFGPRAVDDIRPFLASRHVVVREGATLALSRVGTDAAREALRARLAVEPAPHVREAIARGLRGPGG